MSDVQGSPDWTSKYLASGKFDEHSEIQIEFTREYESDDSGDFSPDRQAEQLAWQRENEMGLSGLGDTWDDSLQKLKLPLINND